MERAKRQVLSSIEEVAASNIDNSSETTKPDIDLIEDDRNPKRLLTTAKTMEQVAVAPFNLKNQNAVPYGSIFLAFGFLVAFLALGMEFYHQRQYWEIEKKQLVDAIKKCESNASKIDELSEKVTQLKSEKQEFEIRTEYLKKENKEMKDQNLALNQEVVGLREAVTHSKFQLNLTVADLKMQHQEQLQRQREEDQSKMERHAQEMAKSHSVEMEDMFSFINCLTEDDTLPVLGVFQRMFRALSGGRNVDRCLEQIPGRIRHRLT